jgi:hypothetical protein
MLYIFLSFAERQKAHLFLSFSSIHLGFRRADNLAEQPLIQTSSPVCPSVSARLSIRLSVGTHLTIRELLNGLP